MATQSGKIGHLAFQARCECVTEVRDGQVWLDLEDAREEAIRMAREASEETSNQARWSAIKVLAKGQRVLGDVCVAESGRVGA